MNHNFKSTRPIKMDRVARDGLAQATETTDLWMRDRLAAYNRYTATGMLVRAQDMLDQAAAKSLEGPDWAAAYSNWFTPPA